MPKFFVAATIVKGYEVEAEDGTSAKNEVEEEASKHGFVKSIKVIRIEDATATQS